MHSRRLTLVKCIDMHQKIFFYFNRYCLLFVFIWCFWILSLQDLLPVWLNLRSYHGIKKILQSYRLYTMRTKNNKQLCQCDVMSNQCGLSSHNMIVQFVLEGSQLKSTRGRALSLWDGTFYCHRLSYPALCSQPPPYVEQVLSQKSIAQSRFLKRPHGFLMRSEWQPFFETKLLLHFIHPDH